MATEPSETSKLYSDQIRAVVPWIFAGLILIGYAIFIIFLTQKIELTDEKWIKLTHILGSIEAIVFTAVGFVFGAEVNRTRAATAEKNVEKANKEKNDLATEIINKIPAPPASPGSHSQSTDMSELRNSALRHLK